MKNNSDDINEDNNWNNSDDINEDNNSNDINNYDNDSNFHEDDKKKYITCECGGQYLYRNKTNHCKTSKHIKFFAKKEIEQHKEDIITMSKKDLYEFINDIEDFINHKFETLMNKHKKIEKLKKIFEK
jgi:hypothetical protein